MKPAARYCLISLLAALPSTGVAAGKFAWFDDVSAESGAIQTRPLAFGADVYTSTPETWREPGVGPEHKVSIYGDYAPRTASLADDDESGRGFANFGVRWQHRMSSIDRLSVSAQQGDSILPYATTFFGAEALDTRATISWTRELSWSWKPSITGGVFLGDESARDEAARQFGRRYYGFSIGGELRLLQSHTPYVSYRMERSLYDLPEGSSGAMVSSGTGGSSFASVRATDDSSRVAAGWRWQVQRGWSVQAEASYGFSLDNNGTDQFTQDRERSRLFFGTRFDFR